MNPLQVSAQFAAFVWYTKRNAECTEERASAFARTHWNRFLPLANEGLGRLLLAMASPGGVRGGKRQPGKGKPVEQVKELAAAS